ncbi:hypothetical protein GCM10022377_15150 [Zhihengliuella alba]|uniref:VanZ-like domain-containing protein n=1 Tax=Zhihengliuella alba TaxID=547018 RepID=A0ABP7DCN2_9MICC
MRETLGPRPPRSRARLWIASLLLAAYTGFVAVVTLWPKPDQLQFGSAADRVLGVLHRVGVPHAFDVDALELTANIGMFVPLGFLLGLLLPRRAWWLAILLLPGYSVFIELSQAAFLELRDPTVRDVVANTTGGYLGAFLATALRAVVNARDRRVVDRALWERDAERVGAR